MSLTEPTPKDTVLRDGTAQLYHFRPAADRPVVKERLPLLLVPSMINRWYVLDLRPGASLVEAMRQEGFDVWCVDWGTANDEDRYLSWEDVIQRLGRMVRRVRRETGAEKIGLMGYCMGATVSGIYTALHPEHIAAFTNLAGPFDFSRIGMMGQMTQREWFDAEAITAPGNLSPAQMQSGFTALRPTGQISKWITLADRFAQPGYRDSFDALETWANDNIPFPAAAYTTYIGELYQQNLLVQGLHYVQGKQVDLGRITCPVLSVVTERDNICPPAAATALTDRCGAQDKEVVVVPGGHVGGVVGSNAPRYTYPAIARWFKARLDARPRVAVVPSPAEPSPQPELIAAEPDKNGNGGRPRQGRGAQKD
jgi:polyhydroxyalkanoate synthase